jgi:hypothetical protein
VIHLDPEGTSTRQSAGEADVLLLFHCWSERARSIAVPSFAHRSSTRSRAIAFASIRLAAHLRVWPRLDACPTTPRCRRSRARTPSGGRRPSGTGRATGGRTRARGAGAGRPRGAGAGGRGGRDALSRCPATTIYAGVTTPAAEVRACGHRDAGGGLTMSSRGPALLRGDVQHASAAILAVRAAFVATATNSRFFLSLFFFPFYPVWGTPQPKPLRHRRARSRGKR